MTETLTAITKPVTHLRIGNKVSPVAEQYNNSLAIQTHLNWRSRSCCYAHELVGTVCVAVTIPFKRETDPESPHYRRRVLDWDAAKARLARAVARERARQASN